MPQTCITVKDVCDFGNLDESGPLRPRIAMLLSSVFAAAEDYCSRKFSSDTFTEYFDADGQASVLVANPPMTALTSVTDDAQVSERAISTGVNVLWIDEYKRRGEVRLFNNESGFAGGLAGAEIVYVGGYTSATIPSDLKEAICMEVLFRLNDRAVGIGNQSADGASVNYATRNGFAADVADALDRYRLLWKGIG